MFYRSSTKSPVYSSLISLWKKSCSTLSVAMRCLCLVVVAFFKMSRSALLFCFGMTLVKVVVLKADLDSNRQGVSAHTKGTVGLQWQGSPSPSGVSPWQHRVNATLHQANHCSWEIHYLGDRHLFSEFAKGTWKQSPPCDSRLTVKWKPSLVWFRWACSSSAITHSIGKSALYHHKQN